MTSTPTTLWSIVNFGGDMATEVVKQAAERVHQRGERDMIRIREVPGSRGKVVRRASAPAIATFLLGVIAR